MRAEVWRSAILRGALAEARSSAIRIVDVKHAQALTRIDIWSHMKSILGYLSISIFIIYICRTASAEPDLELALKGGPNTSMLVADDRHAKHGFSGGIGGCLLWRGFQRFSLAGQLDLLYTPRGAEAVFDGQYVGVTRMRYFDVTVAARPEARFGRASVYLLLGGGLDVLLSVSQEDMLGMRYDITDDFHKIDVALLAGAGVSLRLPSRGFGSVRLGTVFVEARHDHGLRDSDAINGGGKNRASSLMLGLSVALTSGGASTVSSAPPPGRGGPAQ